MIEPAGPQLIRLLDVLLMYQHRVEYTSPLYPSNEYRRPAIVVE